MKTFLVVKVLDVNYNPHDAKNASVLFSNDTAGPRDMTRTGATGVFEIEVPPQFDELRVAVDDPGFVPVGQDLRIKRGPSTPALSFAGGGQEINVRNLDGHTRGADFSLEVFIVLGQLEDTRDLVEAVKIRNAGTATKYGIYELDPLPAPVLDFTGLTVLDSGPTGWHQFIHNPVGPVTPRGRMIYAKRTTTPKLIGIWVPQGSLVTRERNKVNPADSPLNFHVFYHPSPGVLSGSYPFSFAFVDLILRYMMYWPALHKSLIQQQHAARSKPPILVFPVGEPAQWNGTLGNQSSVLRLLQEIGYFVQRMDKIPFPLQTVGKCAISGFSAGGGYVARALGGDNAEFHNKVLSEIYAFDIRTPSSNFAAALKAWWRGGAEERRFRLYTTDGGFFSATEGIDPGAILKTGVGGAREKAGPKSTVVFTPISPFWNTLNPQNPPDPDKYQKFQPNFTEVHQIFPAIFLQHAMKNSNF